jgi:hypothetical protein
MARSLTVISLLLQSTTYCRYRVYTEFLLTYTDIYRGNRKVIPLGITALQTKSHFHLGMPYILANRKFGHVTGMGENRNAFRVFMESTKGKR